jgi:hypothetical protein
MNIHFTTNASGVKGAFSHDIVVSGPGPGVHFNFVPPARLVREKALMVIGTAGGNALAAVAGSGVIDPLLAPLVLESPDLWDGLRLRKPAAVSRRVVSGP